MRLPATIQHILAQKNTSAINWEVIIVDNASTDDTALCAKRILNGGDGIDYTFTYEYESGLSYARKKGYCTAKYEYLIYCDDDNWLSENYLQLSYKTMSENPKIGILGGRADAVFEGPEPTWFRKFMIDFAIGEQSAAAESLSCVNEVYGAGFIIRKAYLDTLYKSGFKSILSDRKGSQLVSGGDTELCCLAKHFGFEVWYNRDLRLKHLMTRGRLNWNYMKQLYAGNGKTIVYTHAYKYVDLHNDVPLQNLRLPFWLDTFIHKLKYILNFYPKVLWKMNAIGDEDVLRFIAMKAEAKEIWRLKSDYLKIYQSIYNYINSLTGK
jgi:glycosyltransferase involved in cell wall biosynthesis